MLCIYKNYHFINVWTLDSYLHVNESGKSWCRIIQVVVKFVSITFSWL